jgi:hypothetical protein
VEKKLKKLKKLRNWKNWKIWKWKIENWKNNFTEKWKCKITEKTEKRKIIKKFFYLIKQKIKNYLHNYQ